MRADNLPNGGGSSEAELKKKYDTLIKEVCSYYKVSYKEIMKPYRYKYLIKPRKMMTWLALSLFKHHPRVIANYLLIDRTRVYHHHRS